jgi:hypothetical protein
MHKILISIFISIGILSWGFAVFLLFSITKEELFLKEALWPDQVILPGIEIGLRSDGIVIWRNISEEEN